MQLGVVGFVMALWIGMLVPRAHADARQPVPAQAPREGRIALSHNINRRAQSWSADAVFTNTPVWGTVVATDGPCALHHTVPPTGLSAGTITISGTVEPITLIEHGGASAVRYRTSGGVPRPTYVEGAQLTVEAAGGADLPAFAATVAAPRELTGYTPPTSLSRAGGYTATWTAVSGSEIMLILTVTNARREGVLVMCRAPDTGTFTVPASTFSLIPPSLDRALVTVARIAETVQIVGDVRVMVDVMNAVTSGPFLLEPVEPQAPATSPREAAAPETSPRLFLSGGSGIGKRWKTWRAQLGQRLTHGLHLVEELDSLGSVHTSSNTLEEFGSFGAGVRWTPFEPRPRPSPIPLASFIDVRAVYLTAVVGAAVRDRLTTTMTASSEVITWSPMASLAVGLLELQGHDWTLGPELRGQLARFDGRLMRDWQLMIALHLNQW